MSGSVTGMTDVSVRWVTVKHHNLKSSSLETDTINDSKHCTGKKNKSFTKIMEGFVSLLNLLLKTLNTLSRILKTVLHNIKMVTQK